VARATDTARQQHEENEIVVLCSALRRGVTQQYAKNLIIIMYVQSVRCSTPIKYYSAITAANTVSLTIIHRPPAVNLFTVC
jgi:hypothetical protein